METRCHRNKPRCRITLLTVRSNKHILITLQEEHTRLTRSHRYFNENAVDAAVDNDLDVDDADDVDDVEDKTASWKQF